MDRHTDKTTLSAASGNCYGGKLHTIAVAGEGEQSPSHGTNTAAPNGAGCQILPTGHSPMVDIFRLIRPDHSSLLCFSVEVLWFRLQKVCLSTRCCVRLMQGDAAAEANVASVLSPMPPVPSSHPQRQMNALTRQWGFNP